MISFPGLKDTRISVREKDNQIINLFADIARTKNPASPGGEAGRERENGAGQATDDIEKP
jgi:hypothetical protein